MKLYISIMLRLYLDKVEAVFWYFIRLCEASYNLTDVGGLAD